MKPFAALILSGLVFAGSMPNAEARGFRLRSSVFTAASRAPVSRSTAAPRRSSVVAFGAFGSGRPDQSEPKPVVRSVLTADAQGNAAVPISAGEPRSLEPAGKAKTAAPWCPSGRVVGEGTGFCLIN